ncbi:MAG: Na+/H+ antiporter NhaA [Bryobacteraceae bacterium]
MGGIGFTMSLFVTGLAFPQDDLADRAKLGILIASVCAGLIGSALLILNRRSATVS